MLRISGWGDCPAVLGWALSAVTCPYKREAEGEEETLAVETAMMWPPAREGRAHQKLEEARDGFSPRAWAGGKEREAWPCLHLDLAEGH